MEISLASYPSILFDKKPKKALTINWCTGNIWCVHTTSEILDYGASNTPKVGGKGPSKAVR